MKVLQSVILFILCVSYSHVSWGFAIEPIKVEAFTSDSVVIDGNTISIRASVEIDTVSSKQQTKWSDKADFAIMIKANALISPPVFQHDITYTVVSNTHLPELGFEFNHTLGKSTQLNYRTGASIGFSSRFNESKVDTNIIGFIDDEEMGLSHIVVLPDDLQNEKDTIPGVPIQLRPHLKFIVGLEWHGVMRKARGWRCGVELEWTPIKDQLTNLYTINDSLSSEEWEDVDYRTTYSIDKSETNFLHIRGFTSWSPWNRQWFLRGSILWSPKKTEGGITLGYHL